MSKKYTLKAKDKTFYSDDPIYVTICTVILWDKRISAKNRGIYSTVMTLPTGDFRVKDLLVMLPESKATIYKCITELIKYGYAKRIVVKNAKGQFTGYKYEFFELPLKAGTNHEKR